MKNYNSQYKAVFFLSWIVLYFIFPVWISKHTVVQSRFPDLDYSSSRALVMLGLTVYFSISAYLMNRYFNVLAVDRPFITKISDWSGHVKNNLLFVAVCLLAVILHIHTFSYVTILGELPFLRRTFWMYDVLSGYWGGLFDFPLQYAVWALLFVFLTAAKQKKISGFISNFINALFSFYKSNSMAKFVFIPAAFVFFTAYAYLFPYYSWAESLNLIRYPPVSKLLYLITYFAFGDSHIWPRILQLTFYILSSVYLYRTISLFNTKETALLGSTIYLFSPIIFSYASQAALTSGTLFFIISISFYFLRFIKDGDNRDLILTTYFISIGFMYKRVVLLMFIICLVYLVFSKTREQDWNKVIDVKILLLSLIPVLPWLKIGPGMYKAIWSNLITFNELTAFAVMIQTQLSWIIFILFVVSFIFILFFERDHLSFFFGAILIAYYFFFTLMEVGEFNYRYSLAFYPAVAVFLSRFIFSLTQKIKMKHGFALVFSAIIIYMITICIIPRTASSLTTWRYHDFETQYYPLGKAADWIKDEVTSTEGILIFYMIPFKFYLDRIYPDSDMIVKKNLIFSDFAYGARAKIYPLSNLRKYCREKKISYVLFPFSPNNKYPQEATPLIEMLNMTGYLKENIQKDFIKVAEFNLEDNYIYIYKLKEHFIN